MGDEMENEIPKHLVWLTEGDTVVAKAVLDLTDEDHARLRNAEEIYSRIRAQTQPITDEEMQTLIEAVDARHLPADDPTSFAIVNSEISRKAREQRDAETRAAESEAQRQAQRAEYLQPSNRAETARQLQPNQEPLAPASAPPARVWTDAELEAMSSDDMVRHGIVTRSTRIEDRQGNTGVVLQGERPWERRPPRQRHIKVSPEELAAEDYRRRVIAHDEALRKQVKQDLSRAAEQQREQQELERKKRRGK